MNILEKAQIDGTKINAIDNRKQKELWNSRYWGIKPQEKILFVGMAFLKEIPKSLLKRIHDIGVMFLEGFPEKEYAEREYITVTSKHIIIRKIWHFASEINIVSKEIIYVRSIKIISSKIIIRIPNKRYLVYSFKKEVMEDLKRAIKQSKRTKKP